MANAATHQRIEIEDVGEVTVVTILEKTLRDEYLIQQIGDDLYRLVDELRRRKLLLNFAAVEIMSSAMIGKLVHLNKKLQDTGGKLVLCRLAPHLQEVITISKLWELNIVKDEQTGLEAF